MHLSATERKDSSLRSTSPELQPRLHAQRARTLACKQRDDAPGGFEVHDARAQSGGTCGRAFPLGRNAVRKDLEVQRDGAQ